LKEIAAEIKTYNHFPYSETDINFDKKVYESKLAEVQGLPIDILVDFIYKFASEQAECTNGGGMKLLLSVEDWKLHVCPYSNYTVSFNRVTNNEKD
jgi:hypothetical protein